MGRGSLVGTGTVGAEVEEEAGYRKISSSSSSSSEEEGGRSRGGLKWDEVEGEEEIRQRSMASCDDEDEDPGAAARPGAMVSSPRLQSASEDGSLRRPAEADVWLFRARVGS